MNTIWFLVSFFVPFIAVFFTIFSTNISQILEDDVNVHFRNYESCTKLMEEGLIGAEDLVRLGDHLFITGTDDRISLWEVSTPNKTVSGNLFAINSSNNKVRKLPLINFPSDVAFHPHGLYLFPNKGHLLLYVINHAYNQGGERIDVFKVTGSSIDQVMVEYFQTIKPETFSNLNGVLNNLVVVEPGQLFVTQYRPLSDSLDGRGTIKGILNLLLPVLGIKAAPVWFCSFDPDHPGEVGGSCNEAADPLISPNGIALDKDGFVYVVDPLVKTVIVYKREENKLIFSTSFKTPRAIDNLIPDHSNGKMYGGSLVTKEFSDFVNSLSHDKKPEKSISGGLIEITIEKTKDTRNNYLITQPIFLPGSLFSGISVATRESDKVILGSWHAEGVLICTLKE